MNEQIKLLLDYQELDKQLRTINGAIMKTEEAVKYYQAGKFLKTVGDTLADLDGKAQALINKYNGINAKIKELTERANEQLIALDECEEDEIAYITKKYKDRFNELAVCETELNAVIKEFDAVNKEYKTLAEQNKVMRAQFQEFEPKFKDIKASKEGEIKQITSKQEKLKGGIDKVVFEKYSAKLKDKKFPIVYGIKIDKKGNANCYCGNAFFGNLINDLLAGKLCECESCRSLIYAEE